MAKVAETQVEFHRSETRLPIRSFVVFMACVCAIGFVFATPELIYGYLHHSVHLIRLAWLSLGFSAASCISILLVRMGHTTMGVYAWSLASSLLMSLIALVAVGFVPAMLSLAVINLLVVALFISPRQIIVVTPFVIIFTALSTYLEYWAAWPRLETTGIFVFLPLLVNVIALLVIMSLVMVLGNVLLRALKTTEDYVKKLETATKEELKYIATHDPLTGLPNRLLLNDRFQQARARAKRFGHFLGVLIIDLDDFKSVNDTLGHGTGDQLLKAVAGRFQDSVRQCDTVSRLGGDEFVVLLDDLAAAENIRVVAERIMQGLEAPIAADQREIPVRASIGISVFPSDGETIEALLKNADVALYTAKDDGRSTFRFFSTALGAGATEKAEMIAGLRTAVDKGEMVLFYQPMVDLTTGRLAGMEALLRWRRGGGELMSPMTFIPAAEESGLIVPIGKWVLTEACRQVMRWKEEGFDATPIAVNLSVRQVQHADLVSMVHAVLTETGVDPTSIELEITESSVMQDLEDTIDKLRQLSDLGIKIVIDDFGSGYSSLFRLSALPISALKIDRFFIQNIEDDPDNTAIVMAIISMAHHMKLQVIAEGIETTRQLEYLKSLRWRRVDDTVLRCDRGQGFLFARPIPADEVRATVSKLLQLNRS